MAVAKLFDFRLQDAAPPLVTEDVFRIFAGSADIQEVAFDPLYAPTKTGWALDAGMSINVVVRAGRWDDGLAIWDDQDAEWMAGEGTAPRNTVAHWGTQANTWGDGICQWS